MPTTGVPPPSKEYPAKVIFHTRTPQELLDAGYDSLRIEKRKNTVAPWTAVTLTQPEKDILILNATQYNYHYVDPKSLEGYEYRAVLQNSVTPGTPADVPQPEVKAVDVAFEQVMTLQEFKELYLWGQDTAFITDEGVFQPDYTFVHNILTGIHRVESALDIKILPQLKTDIHDWQPDAYGKGFIQLAMMESPVLSLNKVTLKIPGSADYEFPTEWLRLDKTAGLARLSIVPSTPSQMPGVSAARRYGGYIPQALEVEYLAGFDLRKGIPTDIKECIGMEAAMQPMNVGGDLVGGAGLAGTSLSMDGLSQSVTTTNSSTNAGFGARILMYGKQLKAYYASLKPRYGGIKMMVA